MRNVEPSLTFFAILVIICRRSSDGWSIGTDEDSARWTGSFANVSELMKVMTIAGSVSSWT